MPTVREKVGRPFDLKQAVLDAYAVNERMNQILLAATDNRAWRADPLNHRSGRGRTIAAIFTHIHNARVMWLKWSAKGSRIPPRLDRKKCTKKQAAAALAKSADAMGKLFKTCLERPDGRVQSFPPDAAHFLCWMIAHDAHHRGQIMMLYRQLGFQFPVQAAYGIWHWGKLWQQVTGVKRPLN